MDVRGKARALYRWANAHSGGSLDIVNRAVRGLGEARVPEAAAGLAYYTIFSLFPLLLALVAVGSFFLGSERVYQGVVSFATDAFPVSESLIESNIQQVLDRRGAVGVLGLIGLLWSGTGVFTVLVRHINRAWTEAEPRNFLERRLVALRMVGVLMILLVLSLLSTPLLNLLPQLRTTPLGDIEAYETFSWVLFSNVLPWLFTFLTFWGLYRWVPNTEVHWSDAFWGAVVVAFAWELAKRAFTWYLGSGLARYRLVYGSLGTVIALMLWIYLSSWLALFGAHLSAAVAQRRTSD